MLHTPRGVWYIIRGSIPLSHSGDTMKTRIYDAGLRCPDGGCCPVADLNEATGMVTLHDPAVPEKGTFILTKAEWNALLVNGSEIK